MHRILVSACLIGQPVGFDGRSRPQEGGLFERWRAEGRLVSFCPEVRGGLPVPRPPAEIVGGTGGDVLDGRAKVLTVQGTDVTEQFLSGARQALDKARSYGIRLAILKQRSPSCGSLQIYDGSFSKRSIPGEGVTTALLERDGIRVFGEDSVELAAAYLAGLDR